MITPTVGRKVWFRANNANLEKAFFRYDATQPCDATIVYVHGDHMVNLVVHDHAGVAWQFRSVNLRQDSRQEMFGMYCEWMPYQMADARRTDANPLGREMPAGLRDGQTWVPGQLGPAIPNLADIAVGSPAKSVLPITACSGAIAGGAQILGGTGQLS